MRMKERSQKLLDDLAKGPPRLARETAYALAEIWNSLPKPLQHSRGEKKKGKNADGKRAKEDNRFPEITWLDGSKIRTLFAVWHADYRDKLDCSALWTAIDDLGKSHSIVTKVLTAARKEVLKNPNKEFLTVTKSLLSPVLKKHAAGIQREARSPGATPAVNGSPAHAVATATLQGGLEHWAHAANQTPANYLHAATSALLILNTAEAPQAVVTPPVDAPVVQTAPVTLVPEATEPPAPPTKAPKPPRKSAKDRKFPKLEQRMRRLIGAREVDNHEAIRALQEYDRLNPPSQPSEAWTPKSKDLPAYITAVFSKENGKKKGLFRKVPGRRGYFKSVSPFIPKKPAAPPPEPAKSLDTFVN
jgi:hypothetical protein